MNPSAYKKYLIHKFYSEGIVRSPKVLPKGIDLYGKTVLPSITGEILSFDSARTRYENYLPVCRAEDIHALKNCSSCAARKHCSPELRLDIVHLSGILRFYLSQAALRNFMLFLSMLHRRHITPEGTTINISVLNRGRWGELTFDLSAKNL